MVVTSRVWCVDLWTNENRKKKVFYVEKSGQGHRSSSGTFHHAAVVYNTEISFFIQKLQITNYKNNRFISTTGSGTFIVANSQITNIAQAVAYFSRKTFAALTMLVSCFLTSSHFLVFRPQSGLIQSFSLG